MRRAAVLKTLGRYPEAVEDLSVALVLLRRADDEVWVARTLTHRGEVYLATGSANRAGADFASAEQMFAATGQELEHAKARHNLGLAAFAAGDVPGALRYLAEAETRYEELGAVNPDLPIDRCAVLLAAGLAVEAKREAEAALARMPPRAGPSHQRAELLFGAANAALAAGDLVDAREFARRANELFGRQGRPLWQARAELILVQARFAAGERSARLGALAVHVADRLARLRAEEASRAHLVAGQLLLARGRRADAEAHLDVAARATRRRAPLTRCVGWLARALRAQARGDRRAVLVACAKGLAAVQEHQATLGDSELRARATAHGRDLATIALREAERRRDARLLLDVSERWRATAIGRPPAPPDDPQLAAELTALREISRRLAAARDARSATTLLDRERRRLEDSVRARSHRTSGVAGAGALGSGPAGAPGGRFDVRALLTRLGDTTLVELVDVDGRFHAVTAGGGRVRDHLVGPAPEHVADPARAALRRLAHGGGTPGTDELLARLGEHLQEVLLGPAVADLGSGPVVLVPPSRLHAVPWALLPALAGREVSVAPSAAVWLRARAAPVPAERRVVLVVGPALGTGGAEVPQLHERYPDATVLSGADATVERVLAALDGAWLAHVAAHGRFRADNPLFSALHLDDGPLTVHDLRHLARAPDRLILSSCDSGVGAPLGADELLGMVTSLMSLGAAGVLAAIGPVHDEATVPLMLALHAALGAGAELPAALLAARRRTAGSTLATATGASFLATGR